MTFALNSYDGEYMNRQTIILQRIYALSKWKVWPIEPRKERKNHSDSKNFIATSGNKLSLLSLSYTFITPPL